MFQYVYDKVIVLSQPARKDRRKAFQSQAERIGLDFQYFDSVIADTPRMSFCLSHHAILKYCMQQNYENALVLEDDCCFVNMQHFYAIHKDFKWIATDWIYYGCNARPYPDHIPPRPCSEHTRIIQAAYTTHAIGYSADLIRAISEAYDPSTGEMYDAFLDRAILPSVAAHVTIPFLCVQQPAFSDLWNRNVDYLDTFKASEEYLRNIC